METLTTTLAVHEQIVADAVAEANQLIQGYPEVLKITLGSTVFMPGSNLEHSLSLRWDPGLDEAPQEIIDTLHRVGIEALKTSIYIHNDTIAGLIVGHAKNGNNYFDIFKI